MLLRTEIDDADIERPALANGMLRCGLLMAPRLDIGIDDDDEDDDECGAGTGADDDAEDDGAATSST